ncbi:hypothetical protein Tco_1329422 [Tanacetum coccineum]
MTESSSQIPSSPELILKEEPDTQDRPESPNPFLPADQVEFTFDEITLSTKNGVALIYPSHPKSEYFKYTVKTIEGSKICVSTPTRVRPWSLIGYNEEIGAKGTLRKSHLPLRWRLLMAQIIQCLGGKTDRVDQISNTDAIILYYLANGVKVDFSKISWEDIIQKLNKKTWEKVVPYPRFISLLLEYVMPEYDHEDLTINPTQVFNVLNWALKPNQPERTPFTDHMLAIYNTDVLVENKAPKTSTPAEKKAKDTSPGHPSASTPVVAEMHKEAQQETGDPTSLGATSKEGINPQLNTDMSASKNNESIFFASTTFHSESTSGCDASTDSTAEADLGFSAPNDSMPQHQDEPIIVSDESDDKEDVDKNADTRDSFHTNPEDTSVPHPPSLKSVQLQELKNQNELVDLIGTDVVEKYHNKLLYDKYYDKMLKRRKSSKIINYDVLTKKGPITLKVYRKDETNEVISNFEVSDLHLAEWKEMIQACPHRKEKGWKTIYGLIKTKMEYLNQTEKELKIDFNKPLKEQDPLDELNDLANKKIKRTGDVKDLSRSTKKNKSSIQHEEELESLKVLQRQLFRSLEDWEVSSLQFMQRYRN